MLPVNSNRWEVNVDLTEFNGQILRSGPRSLTLSTSSVDDLKIFTH